MSEENTHYYECFYGNCGMGVIYEMGTNPEKILREFGSGGWDFDTASIVAFSDNHLRKRGDALAAFIRKHRLGKVVSTGTKRVRNKNSGNLIKAWYWIVNFKKFSAWLAKGRK